MTHPKTLEPEAFWRWAFSDFLSNALRGVLAEYIVAQAIGGTVKPRIEWDAYDLMSEDGLKIEVKSAAYLQSWEQRRPSQIRFDIGLKRGWEAKTNTYTAEVGRAAHIYVFCVFAEQQREQANPLNLEQWFFLFCPTERLNERFPNQKSVSLSALEALGLQRLSYAQLCVALRAAGYGL